MVFYRKYRPQTFDEIAGQVSVKQTLKSAISSGKLSHAYLFCGPKGTGKTSTARILAKVVNCESVQEGNPCNKCSSCLSITDGSNLDVIEMDAASNRGIEDIRTLRENIKLSPTSSLKKVYIIDEAHMLTNDAFNALLKTLEEPPSHVMFILATTEVHKIPQTILSRIQKLEFKFGSVEELSEVLGGVAKKEKLEVDKEALLALAKRANGSFRDGQKFLDQLSSLGKIDQKAVEEGLGSGSFEGLMSLVENIAKGSSKGALENLVGQVEAGINLKELTLSLLDIFRQLLLIKNDLGDQLVKGEVGEEKYKNLQDLSTKFDLDRIILAITSFQNSIEQSRFVSIPTLPLELAVVESCGVSGSVSQRISESEKTETPINRPTDIPASSDTPILRSAETLINRPTDTQASGDIQKIMDRWSYVLETVKQYNFSLEALLRSARISECEGDVVVVEVPYSFHQRILEAPKSRDLLESILSDILGKRIRVTTVLGQRPQRREELANVEIAADDEIVRLAAEIFSSEPVN